MKKWFLWSATAILGLSAVLWSIAQIASSPVGLPTLFPDNALLYIEARDFQSLLKDWNSSEEKRTWLKGDNYAGFSRSRLFERLSQAQSEFSTAASLPADDALLSSVSGAESALAVYDIGNLQFLYITRMAQPKVEATPLWQLRDKFEQRTEGSAQFYVHVDPQSNRTAAFAARDGWLILATREDLVAGALDRLQGAHPHSLPDEPWYADSLKQASGPSGDLRMVLNLEKIVPSPYFRSYWVQRNIAEMKQYRAAISDLHRESEAYREYRILLRKPGITATVSGDVGPLLDLAPEDAVFSSAQASPGTDQVLAALRENLLEVKSAPQQQTTWSSAPAPIDSENAGSTSALEERIDIAPVIAPHSDAYQPLRTLLSATQPSALLETYNTRSTSGDVFVAIDSAIVLVSPAPWDESALQSAISAALRPGLTASRLGIEWMAHTGNGAYTSLTGQVPLHMAVRGNQLFLSNSESLLHTLLSRGKASSSAHAAGTSYSAVFQHTPREQQNARALFNKLDGAGHGNDSSGDTANAGDAQRPSFFSGNIVSLSRMFSHVDRETIDERDDGTQVTQTVVYRWRHS